jgi:glycosyltransferase involved in cell wall biosynthesis
MIQEAARLHYAVPLALQRAGILDTMFTGFYVRRGSPTDVLGRIVRKVNEPMGRRMLGRRCDELDDHRIVSNPWLGIRDYFEQPDKAHSLEQAERGGARFARWILRKGFGTANALMGFVRSVDPILFEHARERGMAVVGDQLIAPVHAELAEARAQRQRFPEWEPASSLADVAAFEARQLRSWNALHHITCASEYVRRGILEGGVDPSRVSVLPYPVDTADYAMVERDGRTGPLTVGFVGAVNLRKGAPYFFDVARRFTPDEARFVMVGPIGLDPAITEQRRGPVKLIGSVPRREVGRRLAGFDVFFFPSTCEGSAGSVVEAMATGLPVVTSPNSGTFARDGLDGFIRAYDDIDGYSECLRQLLGNEDMRIGMGRSARRCVEMHDVDAYSRTIATVFERLLNTPR